MVTRPVGIIDDDAAIRDSLRFLLGARGIEARCYASAAEFLGTADIDALSGLLIDQLMPDISGIELLELLRSRSVVTPAIIMTGGTDATLAQRAKRAGARAILHKPLAGPELLSLIAAAFGASDSRRAAAIGIP